MEGEGGENLGEDESMRDPGNEIVGYPVLVTRQGPCLQPWGGGGGGQCFMQQATYLKEFCSFINSSYACSACIVVGCDTIEDLYFGDPVARDHCHQV